MDDGVVVVPSSGFDSDGLLNLHEQHDDQHASKPVDIQESTHQSRDQSNPLCSSPPSSQSTDSSTNFRSAAMPFSSSPVLYPASSSPAPQPVTKKRKLFQTLEPIFPSKKSRPAVEDALGVTKVSDSTGLETMIVPLSNAEKENGGLELHDDVLDIDDVVPETTEVSESDFTRRFLQSRLSTLPGLHASTSAGGSFRIALRPDAKKQTYEELIAQRSVAAEGRAKKAYYGIDIHRLVDDARIQRELDQAQKEFEAQEAARTADSRPVSRDSAESGSSGAKAGAHLMWTEKYRAKKFTELVGDERTHRAVLLWLKGWDDMVFPGNRRQRPKRPFGIREDEDRNHRKILLLTGPPGLGKTTLAHVCAKKAGYETVEINASDDRSRDVVRGRIKDALGTENVRGIKEAGKDRRAGKPVCVVVDEVDGVTTGSGGSGEGGFMKALIDLTQLDQQNAQKQEKSNGFGSRKKKGDNFRMRRPLILVCNDVYAPSLRPLRASGLAEIVHVRKPALDKVITRLKTVFDTENILCDNDAVRRICESAWGMGTRKQNSLGGRGAGEGDLRGILVQAEWMAHKFRSVAIKDDSRPRLTRKWVEGQVGEAQSSSGNKGLGRGGTREVMDRIFVEGAGLPNLPTSLSAEDARIVAESTTTAVGVANIRKRAAITALRQMVDTCGEHDRLMTECFTTWPSQVFQDDTQLSKPNAAYDWLHFHDCLSSRVYGSQEWELGPYMNTGACAFHTLFASVDKGNKAWNDEKKDEEEVTAHPYSGPRADFSAYEAEKQNKTVLTELQSSFSAPLLRLFSSVENMATELIPAVNRMLAPDVKPVVVGGHGGSDSVASVRKETEKACVRNAVRVMHGLSLKFEKVKLEVDASAGPNNRATFVFRMEP